MSSDVRMDVLDWRTNGLSGRCSDMGIDGLNQTMEWRMGEINERLDWCEWEDGWVQMEGWVDWIGRLVSWLVDS